MPTSAGNRQLISVGNVAGNDRVALILMDYAHRTRLKMLGRARRARPRRSRRAVPVLVDPGYRARPQRAMVITVEGFDWNCPQHIPVRIDAEDVERALDRARRAHRGTRGALARTGQPARLNPNDDDPDEPDERLPTMSTELSPETLARLFTEARTHHGFTDRPVPDHLLRKLYDVAKWAPTAFNMTPARFVFVKSKQAKEKLSTALLGSNVEQTMQAPVTVIVATDTRFYDELPRLFPAFDARALYAGDEAGAHTAGFRNATLQGAYLLLASRALGLTAAR